MFEAIFAFLFKYRPLLFQEGSVRWVTDAPWVGLTLAALGAALAFFTYRSVRGKTRPADRLVLAGVRTVALLGLAALLFRPTLILSRTLPQQNFVAVLVDDSRSMALSGASEARADFALQQLGPDPESLVSRLGERFAVRTFRFSDVSERVDSLSQLTFDGTRTDLAGALDRVRQDLEGVPLAGVVVMTDGADNAGGAVTESLLPFRAEGVPVFTVGLGEEELSPDIQISRVEAPSSVLMGGSVVVDVVIAHTGYPGQTVSVLVEDDGLVVSAEEVELGPSGQPTTVRVHMRADTRGPRLLSVRVPPRENERITENNQREVLLTVEDETEKILYFEGEPRYEVAFLRRAVQGDANLQLVILQRTAEDKFLPLNVDDEHELSGGFPTTREQLFRYRSLVLGSVEASFFTHDQLQMIADFVSERGGGLLLLGGPRAFAEGGYSGTPLEDVLPILLEDAPASPQLSVELQPMPTRAGFDHPILRIDRDTEANRDRWEAIPTLSSFNPFYELKPAATALLTADDGSDRDRILMAHHRFGRGRVLAFPVNDSWVWQMHHTLPLEDQTHELFWRQTLRWLVDGTPDPVRVALTTDRVDPGSSFDLRAQVEDSAFSAVNGATVRVTQVDDPDSASVRLDWDVDRDGEYTGAVTIPTAGTQRLRITAERDGQVLGEQEVFVRGAPSDAEYFDAGMRSSLLRRVADDTGGRFYRADEIASLPEDVQYTGAGVTVTEERDLWDMPALFLLLFGALAFEWGYRRMRGLA